MALNTVSSDRLSTNVKNTNFTAAEKQDLTDDIKPLLGSSGGGNKNLIINGAMQVAQRGTSFTSVTASAYHLDRFQYNLNGTVGAATVTQATVTDLAGFTKSLKVDCTTADASQLQESSYVWVVSKDAQKDFDKRINKSNCLDS